MWPSHRVAMICYALWFCSHDYQDAPIVAVLFLPLFCLQVCEIKTDDEWMAGMVRHCLCTPEVYKSNIFLAFFSQRGTSVPLLAQQQRSRHCSLCRESIHGLNPPEVIRQTKSITVKTSCKVEQNNRVLRYSGFNRGLKQQSEKERQREFTAGFPGELPIPLLKAGAQIIQFHGLPFVPYWIFLELMDVCTQEEMKQLAAEVPFDFSYGPAVMQGRSQPQLQLKLSNQFTSTPSVIRGYWVSQKEFLPNTVVQNVATIVKANHVSKPVARIEEVGVTIVSPISY